MRLENLADISLPNYSARIMRGVADELGVDWVQLADDAQINPSKLDSLDAELSGFDELRLQRAFARATRREPAAWFETGLRFHILTMGPLGMATLTAPNTVAGLRNAMNFQDLCPSMLHYDLIHENGELVGLSADDQGVPADIRERHLERALGCVTRFLADMWQHSRLISHIEIKLDRAKNWCGCEDKFGFPVIFGANRTRWVFKPGTGYEALPLASPLLEESYGRLMRVPAGANAHDRKPGWTPLRATASIEPPVSQCRRCGQAPQRFRTYAASASRSRATIIRRNDR